MLRLSKRVQIILMSSICVILLASLGWVYWQRVQEHRQVSQELNPLRTILARPYTSPTAGLEAKIAHSEAELAALKSRFPNPSQSLRISQALFDLAESCQVELLSLGVSLAADAGHPTLNLNLSLRGKTSHLLDFIDRLNGALPTAEIVSTSMVPAEAGGGQAGLKLQVHTR